MFQIGGMCYIKAATFGSSSLIAAITNPSMASMDFSTASGAYTPLLATSLPASLNALDRAFTTTACANALSSVRAMACLNLLRINSTINKSSIDFAMVNVHESFNGFGRFEFF